MGRLSATLVGQWLSSYHPRSDRLLQVIQAANIPILPAAVGLQYQLAASVARCCTNQGPWTLDGWHACDSLCADVPEHHFAPHLNESNRFGGLESSRCSMATD